MNNRIRSTTTFIGREEELTNLERLIGKKVPSLVVIKGRRRDELDYSTSRKTCCFQ